MEKVLYDEMYQSEREHWWFLARRELLLRVFEHNLPKGASILDVGCGTGFVLEELRHHFDAYGLDHAEIAVQYCHSKGIVTVHKGLLGEYNFGEKKFDMISFLDVIEHIDNDLEVITQAKSLMKETGMILVTVPAFQFLWSAHDEIHHHKRRYTKDTLVSLLTSAGFQISFISYFNMFLFPLIALARVIGNLTGRHESSDATPTSPALNKILYHIFASEKLFLPKIQMPFGVSLLAVAQLKK